MIINKSGIAIRFDVSTIRVMGRATQGVRLINLEKREDEIASVCKVDKAEEEEEEVVNSETSAEFTEAQENFEQLGENLENNNEQ
jgi:DNA gyrase subunit A